MDLSEQAKHSDERAPDGSGEKISSIRSAIDAKLREDGVYQQIRELILSKAARETTPEPVGGQATEPPREKIEDQLIHEVLQSELVKQLLDAVRQDSELKRQHAETADGDDAENSEPAADANEPTLFLRLAGGRAFVDQLTQEDTVDDEGGIGDGVARITQHQIGFVRQFFRVMVSFQGQRVSSRDVACCVDPPFNEHFRLRIAKRKTRSGRTKSGGLYEIEVVAPWESLCLVDEHVEIVLLKLTKKVVDVQHATGVQWLELKRELLAIHHLDWRRVLCSTLQLVHAPIQLVDKMKVPVGTLDVRLDLLHFARTASIAKDVAAFLNKEALEKNTLSHAFYRYAKEWWHEYRSEMDAVESNLGRAREGNDFRRLDQRSRLVKLFAEDDEGRFRMVCKFLRPLRAPLAVRSPSEAARFVSLLPHESTAVVGRVSDEAWQSVSTTLAVGKGDTHDHAILIASLLLGCGLDAYVCIGSVSSRKRHLREKESLRRTARGAVTASEVGHVWIMTRDPDRPNDADGVLFWESINGERYHVRDHSGVSHHSALRHGFLSIDCVFSATRFYANLQPRRWKISEYSFNFDDDAAWKALDPRRIADLPACASTVLLTAPDVAAVIPKELEWATYLKKALVSQRRARGLVTKWNDELGFYLQPALNSYELERLHCVPQLENELFQQTIKQFVKEGFTFEAVPIMFPAGTPQDAAETLAEHEIARKILGLQGRAAQFGLAARCFAYAESRFVVWVMLAVSYQT